MTLTNITTLIDLIREYAKSVEDLSFRGYVGVIKGFWKEERPDSIGTDIEPNENTVVILAKGKMGQLPHEVRQAISKWVDT